MNKKIMIAAIGACGFPLSCYALPGINLGNTSFYDAVMPPTGPGFYFIQYMLYGESDHIYDADGNVSADIGITTLVPASQILYLTEKKVLGAHVGLTAVVPFLAQADMDGMKTNTGVGDLTLGAMLQYDPFMGEDGPIYSHRFEVDISVPTGEYNASNVINPSSNTYYLDPHYSLTYWFTPRWTMSSRISYLMWNGKNNDPFGGAKSTKDGEALHVNIASAYQVSDNWSIGIAGYVLRQLSDNEVDGVRVPDSKERVWGIGPGLLYAFSADDSIVANFYVENDVRNRPKNTRAVLRFNHHF